MLSHKSSIRARRSSMLSFDSSFISMAFMLTANSRATEFQGSTGTEVPLEPRSSPFFRQRRESLSKGFARSGEPGLVEDIGGQRLPPPPVPPPPAALPQAPPPRHP